MKSAFAIETGQMMKRGIQEGSFSIVLVCCAACLMSVGCAQAIHSQGAVPSARQMRPPTGGLPSPKQATSRTSQPLTVRGQQPGYLPPPAQPQPTPSYHPNPASQPNTIQPVPQYGLPAQNFNTSPASPPQTVGTTPIGQPPVIQPPRQVGPPLEPIGTFQDAMTNPPQPVAQPIVRTVPVDVYVTPARTGRFMIGGAVNSDAGVTGQITLDERNFDIMRFPRSFQDLFSGYAFRGAGQTFRLEAVPGSDFQRYMVSFGQPYLFGYMPLSLSVQGFLFDRRYRDWDESRLGGRVQLGYRVTNDLSLSTAIRAENVDMNSVRIPGTPEVDSFVGDHDLYSGSVRLTHDTRDIPFAPTEGHLLELSYEQTFGSFDYSRWQGDLRQYYLMRQRADGSGRHTLSFRNRLGISGEDTPIFENFFAGGYSTIRGFDFRGASPVLGGMQVGGRLSLLGSLEYQFPLTADDATKGVVFVDYGTVETNIEIERENFRVAPGFGFRVSMPALGPAPLAFDFAFPVAHADTDDRQVFSFFMGFSR